MTALTMKLENRAGRFTLVDDNGVVTAHGIARPSSRPGYVTLTFTKVHKVWTPGTPIRVPADWQDALMGAPES